MRLSILGITLVVLFALATPASSVLAATPHQQAVLGTQTAPPALGMPPTVEGPGLVLPDSPFYVLDKIKQEMRLLVAFSSKEKALTHASILGERYAELRFMLAKEDTQAVALALEGVSYHAQKASEAVRQMHFEGKDTKTLAKTLNDSLKEKQQVLDTLEVTTKGQTQEELHVALAAITEAKVLVEDALGDADLRNEVRYDIAREVAKRVARANSSAKSLDYALQALEKQTKEAAETALSRREAVLQQALAENNAAKRDEASKQFAQEKKKQTELLKVNAAAIEQAKRAIQSAQEAAAKFEAAQKATDTVVAGLESDEPLAKDSTASSVLGNTAESSQGKVANPAKAQ